MSPSIMAILDRAEKKFNSLSEQEKRIVETWLKPTEYPK